MHLKNLTPMLWTENIPATIAFYTTVLGFEVDEYNEDWRWCHIHRNGVSLMFTSPNEHAEDYQAPSCTGSFYIYLDEVDELWESIQDKAAIGYEIANFPHGMREFAVFDNNGYMLQFGRELMEGEEIVNDEF